MLYGYRCPKCSFSFDLVFSIGKATSTGKCPECGSDAKREFSPLSFKITGGSISAASSGKSFGQEMLKKNQDAAERMKGNKPPVRRVGTQYQDGRVEAV
jgi:putative FmdB family regulatory protein